MRVAIDSTDGPGTFTCRDCDRTVKPSEIAAWGSNYIRCRPCVRASLAGATVKTLDVNTGTIR